VSPREDEPLARLLRDTEPPEPPGGRYQVLERLGRGGMGSVWLARDTQLDRMVAIKVVNEAKDDRQMAARLRREAFCVAALEHPGIVPVHELGELPDGRTYYVMKRVEGKTLEEWRAGGHSLPERLRLMLRLAEIVAFAHERGFVHRDLKPENVMVGPFGELYVMDWGLALPGDLATRGGGDDAPGITRHGEVLGTPGFMAPEQRAGGGVAIDARADVYAAGALLEFLAGALANRPLRAVIARARAEDPDERYPSIVALAEDVTRFLDREPIEAYRENPLERSVRFLARHQYVVWLIVGYLVLRALVVFFTGR